MTRPYRGLAGLLIPDTTGQRAIEETLADWRDERARAASAAERLLTDARGLGSLLRVFVAATRVELCSREVWHLFGLTLGAAALGGAVLPLVWVFIFADVFAQEGSDIVAAVVTLTVNQSTVWFSVAAAIGFGQRRGQPAPVLGSLTLALVFMLLVLGWIGPAANQAFRIRVWTPLTADLSLPPPPPAPGMSEWSLPVLVRLAVAGETDERAQAQRGISMRTALFLGAPTCLLLGAAVRRRLGERRPWRLAQAASGAAAVAMALVGNYFWRVIAPLVAWPAAVHLEHLNIERWLALAIGWAAIVVLGRLGQKKTEPRNPTASAV